MTENSLSSIRNINSGDHFSKFRKRTGSPKESGERLVPYCYLDTPFLVTVIKTLHPVIMDFVVKNESVLKKK